ncbi:MAG TPA: hypothetical protein VKI64_08575 [Acidimicrobiales bacterium]|nr:hypothetical protein [Acidimicrobiales bacterium]
MGRRRLLTGGVVLAVAGAIALVGPAARADNSPTFRDCSAFAPGFDPDFVEISGVAVGADGGLTVSPSQNSVQLLGAESSDPGDSAGHVTLTATVTAPGVPAQTTSGAGTGQVVLQVPLVGSGAGRTYTVSWSATFDNGNHPCPSTVTPENTPADPHPFVVTVSRTPAA